MSISKGRYRAFCYMYMYMHIYSTCIWFCICICIYKYICISICKKTCIYIYIYPGILSSFSYAHIFRNICIYICTCKWCYYIYMQTSSPKISKPPGHRWWVPVAVRGSTPLQSLDRDNLETIDEMVAERFIVGYLYIDCMNDIYVYMVCIDTHTHTYRIFTYSDLKQIHIHKSNKLKLSYRISVSDPPQTSFGFWEFETSPLGFFFMMRFFKEGRNQVQSFEMVVS